MGNHSADFGDFEATADLKSSSAPKSPKNYESNTAIPRILEEEKEAWRKNADTLESTFAKSPKMDSSNEAQNLNDPTKDSRICKNAQNVFSQNATRRQDLKNLESSFDKNEQATQKMDSRENVPTLNTPQAQANLDSSKSPSDSKILDEKCGLQGKSQGSYLSGNDRRDFSPLPHFSLKAESPQAQKPTPNQHKGANNATQSFHTIYTACGFYRKK